MCHVLEDIRNEIWKQQQQQLHQQQQHLEQQQHQQRQQLVRSDLVSGIISADLIMRRDGVVALQSSLSSSSPSS